MIINPKTRIERDSLGELDVPEDAYYGVQTRRAMYNFPVSGRRERPEFVRAYILVKKAAAITNMELGVLDEKRGNAIVKAADEVLEGLSGRYHDQFPVDVFQAGAGTSFNMNVNEVLANRALELLGRKRGDYAFLSPNDYVNKAQSTNDTFPTASHIGVIFAGERLLDVLSGLSDAFREKAVEFSQIPKSGRTHLMDAVPVSLGAEFGAYASSLERAASRIEERLGDLLELPIGGTATGTGANTHPQYRETVISKLTRLCSLPFHPALDSFEVLQSRSQLAAFSGALRELALELIRIANDLRLLNAGPTTGISEIVLPPVQPGSSIMPGKYNPVMAECLDMIGFQIVGNDTTVAMAAQAGQLELNVMTPVMTCNILESIALLTNYLPVFRERCVEGIKANEESCRAYLELNPILVTFLTPKIGYLKAAELAKEALERRVPVAEVAVMRGVLSKEEADELLEKKLLKPSAPK
ncbi:Fumarate hydratase class II [Methanosarcina sp. MTP4]|uniref:aspartate ammonia-lyase n=1 Tax=Methanosarcina sp. MTP4 TaxID=1434100 RepID=UPI0006156E02|nr:aspartate ammonia-lyase [Methanosarcina sp. MTP4]AKB25614.1 Fumarate hydratase class II [Methanosarcina sp. MTP4]